MRRAALVRVGLCHIKGHYTSEIYSLPRCESVLRRASRGLQRAPGLCVCAHEIAPLRSLIWGGGAAHALAARSRHAAPVGVDPCTVRGHCSSERPLSYGAWPCADVPTATFNAKQAPRLAWRRRHCALSLSREEAQHACLPRAREALRGLWSLHALHKATAPARGSSSTVHGRAPVCKPWPPTRSMRRVSRGAGATARSLSWEDAHHARLRRVCATLRGVLVGLCTIQGHCAS